MANSVTIRTSAPGAKQAAGEIGMLRSSITGLGSKTGGPLGGMLTGLGGIGVASLGAGVAMGALGAAIGEAGKFLGEGVKSAMEEEKSLASLETALRNNVPAWDGNMDSINETIAANQKLGFSDDDLRASFGKLVTSTRDVEDATRLQAMAMDLARVPGFDLAKATDAVTKANMGSIGPLRRMGINIDKNATSTEALAKLSEMSVGQATAYAETLEGVFASADEALGEMQEHIGEKFLPMFKDMAVTAKDQVIPAVEDLVDVVTGDMDMSNSWMQQALGIMAMMPGEIGAAAQRAIDQFKVDEMGGHIIDEIKRIRDQAAAASGEAGTHTAGSFGNKFNETIKTIRFGKDLTPNLADELRDGVKNDINDAMADVKWAIEHPLQLAKQTAQIEAALTSLNIKRGLASNTPQINAVIDQQIANLEGKWASLTGVGYQKGVNASNALENGLRTFNPPNLPVFGGITTGQGKNRKRKKREAGENAGGGGRAAGGPVSANTMYEVNEGGAPELLRIGGRSYLLNGAQSGHVDPIARGRAGAPRGGGEPVVHVHLPAISVRLSTREVFGAQSHHATIQGGAKGFR